MGHPVFSKSCLDCPKTYGRTPFQTPSAILGPPGGHFGFCKRCGIKGCERVPPSPLGWYYYLSGHKAAQLNMTLEAGTKGKRFVREEMKIMLITLPTTAMPAPASLLEQFDLKSSTCYQKIFQIECLRVFLKAQYRPCEYLVHKYLDSPIYGCVFIPCRNMTVGDVLVH